jgi:hypothetical protein
VHASKRPLQNNKALPSTPSAKINDLAVHASKVAPPSKRAGKNLNEIMKSVKGAAVFFKARARAVLWRILAVSNTTHPASCLFA